MRNRITLIATTALCACLGIVFASAFASTTGFSGSLEANNAPVTFDAVKKDGRYRSVKNFVAGSAEEGVGLPVTCQAQGPIEIVAEGDDPIKVHKDGSFNNGAHWVFAHIKGKFVNKHKAIGTIDTSFTSYPGGDPDECATTASEPWTAKVPAG